MLRGHTWNRAAFAPAPVLLTVALAFAFFAFTFTFFAFTFSFVGGVVDPFVLCIVPYPIVFIIVGVVVVVEFTVVDVGGG